MIRPSWRSRFGGRRGPWTMANHRSPKKRLNAFVPGAAAYKLNLVRHSRKILSVFVADVSPPAKANRGAPLTPRSGDSS
jgi:hypothetical protein